MKQLPFSVGSRRIPRALALVTVFATLSAAQAGTAIYISPSTNTMPTGWNGLDMVNGHAPILHKNLVDSEGNATSVGLLVMSPALGPYPNAGTAFTGDAAEFEPGRSAGSGCCAAMCAQGTSGYGLDDQEAFIRARVTGLDPAKLYEFSFVAQRYNSDYDDSARYTVVGANRGAASLLMNLNSTHVARIPGIAPLPDGSAEFTVVAADANTTSDKWAYLSAMKIEEMDALAAQDIYIDALDNPSSSATKTWNKFNSNALLKDSAGNDTHVSVVYIQDGGNGNATDPLTGDAAEFEEARSGNKQLYFSNTATTTVSGLYPGCTYSFTFVASRAYRNGDSATACAATDYTVTGATTGTASLDAYNNASSVAKVTGIRPDEYGKATITIAKGAGNNLNYAYLLAMKISRETMTSGDHAVAVVATDGGSVSATVGGEASDLARYLSASDTMVATATPTAGYRFVGWTSPGAATATANPLTIPGTSSATWTAVFEKDAAYPSKALYFALDGQPVAPTKTWNNASNETFYSRGAVQTGFRTSDNILTDISLVTVQPFGLYSDGKKPNSNFQGTLTGDAADFNDGYSDYKWFHGLWVQIQWNGNTNTNRAYVAYDVAGLKPNRPYTFRFFGYRANVSDNRSARYWCEGQNAVMATLNPLNNTTQVATCADVVPDADGTVHMVFSPAPANNNGNLFTYHHMLSISGDLPLAGRGTVITFR